MFENFESTPFIHIETAYWWFSCFVCSLFPCFCSVWELFPDKAADCRACFSLTGGGWEVWRGEDSSQMIKTASRPLLPIRKISKAGSDQKWSGECCSRPAFNAPAGFSMLLQVFNGEKAGLWDRVMFCNMVQFRWTYYHLWPLEDKWASLECYQEWLRSADIVLLNELETIQFLWISRVSPCIAVTEYYA